MATLVYQEGLKKSKNSIYVLIRKEIRDKLGITEKNMKHFQYKLTLDTKTKKITIEFINTNKVN